MQHYTYAHYKPNGSIFYIGKGSGDRAYRTNHRNRYWKNIVAKHGSYTVDILARWKTHEEALSHEILLISCFKDMGCELANLTIGGEGVVGYKHTIESLAKMSASAIGRSNPTKGIKRKPHTDETKRQMSVAKLGKSKTEQHRLNISLGKKGIATTIKKGDKLTESHANKLRKHLKIARQKIDHTKTYLPKATCLVCKKTGAYNGMARFHFDNCKEKQ